MFPGGPIPGAPPWPHRDPLGVPRGASGLPWNQTAGPGSVPERWVRARLQPLLGRFMPEGCLDPLPSLQAPHTRGSGCRVPLFCHLWEGSSLFSQLTAPFPAPTSQWQLESKGCEVWAPAGRGQRGLATLQSSSPTYWSPRLSHRCTDMFPRGLFCAGRGLVWPRHGVSPGHTGVAVTVILWVQ